MVEISRRAVLVALGGSAATGFVVLRRNAWLRHPGSSRNGLSVAVLGWSRLALDPSGSTGHLHAHDVGQGHQVHQVPGTPVASAVHGAWTDAVMVDVRVHNGLRRAVELSPGQFRVRVDEDGPTVSLYSADRDAGAVQPGTTTTMRISYLVPPPDRALSLEFSDPDAAGPVRLARLADHHTEGRQS